MVQTRSQNKQKTTEDAKMLERAQNALRWRKFYESNSFEYNRKRLVRRILGKHVVRLATLKKYQLETFYKENTTKDNLKLLKEEGKRHVFIIRRRPRLLRSGEIVFLLFLIL